MKYLLLTIVGLMFPTLASAADLGELVFSDDFQRSESQELKDDPGNGWGTNSRSRAKGNKQVDLRDGAMHIFIHEVADHAVSVTHPATFTDGAVAMRFLLEDPQDSLGLNFADLDYKPVHAGHLFVVRVNKDQVQIQDLKTGNMDLKTHQARLDGTLSPQQKQLLATKTKKIPHRVANGKWHVLLVEVQGDQIKVTVDGEDAGSFQSEGIAHPTKRMLRLSVPRNAVVDDVKIYRKK